MSRIFARLGVVVITGLVLVVGGAPVALAHVTVRADKAVQGGSAEIVFRVPTESDSARTVKVAVALPTDTPIATVSIHPEPGWTYQLTRTTLPSPVTDGHGDELSEVVGQVEWIASDAAAAPGPGEYQEFRMVARPLPETDRLIFKVVQTYDDGTVVRWIDPPVDGGPEPEHPAPVLPVVAPAAGSGDGAVAATVGANEPRVAAPTTTAPPAWWWIGLGVTSTALIAALAAVFVAVRTARRTGGAGPPG